MKKNDKMVWRLKESPSTESLRELVKDEILTKEEARQILFSIESDEDGDVKSLKSEINFLRELVEKLSSKVNYYPIWNGINVYPYQKYPWYSVYQTAFSGNTGNTFSNNSINTVHTLAGSSGTSVTTGAQSKSDGAVSLARYNLK